MNAKKARKLRRIAGVGSEPDLYMTTNHKKHLVPTKILEPEGTQKHVVLETCTIVLDPVCPRAFYQAIKKA